MRTFVDRTKDINERPSEQMSFRAKPHIKQAIRHAAVLNGVAGSVFTMNAAYQAALATIAAHERTVLHSVDQAALFAAFDTPPAATSKLREALAHHRWRVQSR